MKKGWMDKWMESSIIRTVSLRKFRLRGRSHNELGAVVSNLSEVSAGPLVASQNMLSWRFSGRWTKKKNSGPSLSK